MKDKLINYYMDLARRTAQLSYARRMKVGCVIVRDNNIISFGYNGTPPGEDNNCEIEVDGELVTKPNVIHAEQNAKRKLEESGQTAEGSSIFLTLSPCIDCAGLIINSGINEVYYEQIYRSVAGLNFLKANGISCIQVGFNNR